MSKSTMTAIIDWHRAVEVISELMPKETASIHASEHVIRMLTREGAVTPSSTIFDMPTLPEMWGKSLIADDTLTHDVVKFFTGKEVYLGIVLIDPHSGGFFPAQEHPDPSGFGEDL